MRWLQRLFTKNNKIYKDFKKADALELMQTPFKRHVEAESALFWTPIFQKYRASPMLIDYLLDLPFYQDTDIYSQKGDEAQINKMVEAFLDSAFDDEEIWSQHEQDSIRNESPGANKNLNFEQTEHTQLHGNLDFVIYNELTKTFLIILVHEKCQMYTPHNGYFDISAVAALCVQWYMMANFQMEHGFMVITTNGHKWQLHRRNLAGHYEKTKQLCSKDQLIYHDRDTIEAVLGMIRFAAGIKCENQEVIESLYALYNDQIVLNERVEPESQSPQQS